MRKVSSFIGQHFGKKIGLLPTAGAENHAFGGFTAHPLMPSKFEKTRPKPRNLLQSDEQCPGAPARNNVSIQSYRGAEDRGAETLRTSVSRTTLSILPTLASVCSTGGHLQMVKISKRSVRKLKSYEHLKIIRSQLIFFTTSEINSIIQEPEG